MRLLDRYVIKSFLLPFAYCLLAIAAIWLILDLGDKLPSLIDSHAALKDILHFYRIQIPQIAVFCLPIALLLATLYSLSRLSRSNEIVSMVTAGVSIARLLLPICLLGLLGTGLTLALNYQLAPESEIHRKEYFEELTQEKKKDNELSAVLFRNRDEHRTWYFERLSTNNTRSKGVQILQQDEKGNALWKTFAATARYDSTTKVWTLSNGEFLDLGPDGKIVRQTNYDNWKFPKFRETPARIASMDLQAENLGVPALQNYLHMNYDLPVAQQAPFHTHLYYRWALPWTCFLVVVMGGALSIVFSRRGVVRGVVTTLILFFALIFLRSIFLSLGQGGHISPIAGAWTPIILFGLLGGILLWIRSSGSNLTLFRRG